jgi:hypothetical protein
MPAETTPTAPTTARAATHPMTADTERRDGADFSWATTAATAAATGAGVGITSGPVSSATSASGSSSVRRSSWKQRQQYVRVAGFRVRQRGQVTTATEACARSSDGEPGSFRSNGPEDLSRAPHIRQNVSPASPSMPQYGQTEALSIDATPAGRHLGDRFRVAIAHQGAPTGARGVERRQMHGERASVRFTLGPVMSGAILSRAFVPAVRVSNRRASVVRTRGDAQSDVGRSGVVLCTALRTGARPYRSPAARPVGLSRHANTPGIERRTCCSCTSHQGSAHGPHTVDCKAGGDA